MLERDVRPGRRRAIDNQLTGTRERTAARSIGLILLFVTAILISPSAANARPVPGAEQATAAPIAPDAQWPQVVHLRPSQTLVLAAAPIPELEARAQRSHRDSVAALLTNLQALGQAGPSTFDEATNTFAVSLTAAGADQLSANPEVTGVDATDSSRSTGGPLVAKPVADTARLGMRTQNVSSVNFVQVYSPFMWGHTSVGGLSVQLTLLDSTGTITVGVPTQTFLAAPNNYVKIDRTQLYYETVFVDPNNPSHPPVMILPGEKVHVVTTGTDPITGLPGTDDREIPVDDVQAWTSYQNDAVSGQTSLANAPVIVTYSAGSLSLANYLTPGSSMTYATTSANAAGSFSVAQFQTSTSSTLKTIDLQQGSTGFVRVQHADGNEVYAIHGQNVLVLENSAVIHGYAFHLPSSPGGLDSGVTVSRPTPSVTATLTDGQGGFIATQTFVANAVPYTATFSQMIQGGDIVEVSIDQGPINQIITSPLIAHVDLAGSQVVGSGPPNTSLTLGAGRIDGYISKSSAFAYLQKQIATDGSGGYSSGPIQCGTSNQLILQPGSFGYVGYEATHGNFVYEDFAAPRNDVMANYPFVEGWVEDGTVSPLVTLRDSVGNLKSQSSATPTLLYLTTPKLYLNTYYNLTPAQFIAPGDVVTVASGSQTSTIPVDQLTAYLNTYTGTVFGSAPAGATAKVIPAKDRTAYQNATADAAGSYSAGNPFASYVDSSCTVSTRTETFSLGDSGRAYLTHGDGNQVFAAWESGGFGPMNVNENENVVELYLYPTQGVDWFPAPTVTTTVTLAPANGGDPTTVLPKSSGTTIHLTVSFSNAQGKVLIRAGGTITATFPEGPFAGPNQTVTISLADIPLITGTPDVTANTVAGIGPPNWIGQATLNSPPSAKAVSIPTRSSTAYSPLTFVSAANAAIQLVFGYSGVIAFTDTFGNRVWAAWAVTANPVKITGYLKPGDTLVCGKATPGLGITILDASNEPLPIQIGTGVADGQGNFCVSVSPPLVLGQVILAKDSNGTLSQPVIVTLRVFLPTISR